VAPDLPVAYRDADAAGLRLSFALRRRTALRTTTLRFGHAAVELAILGASHQVLVTVDGRLVVAEAVACGTGGEPLSRSAEWSKEGRTLRFSSRVRMLSEAAFAATVGRLGHVLERDPCAIVGLFPGDELSTTGLRAWSQPAGRVAWRTWHAYPQTRELVTTWTTVGPVASGGPA